MLAVIALSFAPVLMLLVAMLRHDARRHRDVEALLDEVAREERPAPAAAPPSRRPAPTREPWEKDPDWWRDGG
jgi:hypothetical protein